ncbi:hypothetical protein ACFRKE_32060, partial [Kitasatospora indigofera]|uniref:hypothetical protein n=1 Tax=Kitasatospora indigofera TaxID=67307 RepID=UPI0036A04FBB
APGAPARLAGRAAQTRPAESRRPAMSQPSTETPSAEHLSDHDAARFRTLLSGLERSLEADRRSAEGRVSDGASSGE